MFKLGVRILTGAFVTGSTILFTKNKPATNNNTDFTNTNLESNTNYTSVSCGSNFIDHNFVQGKLGNCGMIASMATLKSNSELYNKVVPSGQNFKKSFLFNTNNQSEFAFNLYKLGKLHKVVVDESLPTYGFFNSYLYSKSSNGSLLGSLLEKALIQLLFDGEYEAATGVLGHHVLTSFTNNLFEIYLRDSSNSGNYAIAPNLKLHDLVDHGLTTKSQMVVGFDREASKYSSLKTRSCVYFSRHQRQFSYALQSSRYDFIYFQKVIF